MASLAPYGLVLILTLRPTMGTRYTVRVVLTPGDETGSERICHAIGRELALVDRGLGDLASPDTSTRDSSPRRSW